MLIAQPLQSAIEEISKLPGIGKKTAQRLALHLLKADKNKVEQLANTILGLKENLRFCNTCFNITVDEECDICKSSKRDKSLVCVVEDINDLIAIEKSNEYTGVYHVLGGVLSPLSGIGPEQLKINELFERVKNGNIKEVILALNPDTEGEATSLFLAKNLHSYNIKVSRIARGLPVGSDLEFADVATIVKAVSNRIEL